jgi:salicylate 1-O-methyltransferase
LARIAPFWFSTSICLRTTSVRCLRSRTPDDAWAAYQQDGKAETLAVARALSLRATIAPTLATELTCLPGDERYRTFMNQFAGRLTRRVATHPAPLDALVATILLVKGYTE